ncbi:MarR family transcriptional regulator [Sphingomonas sp. HMWF008]|nr:MarR family transcriptional regulator [Sphingomonas sp. HMWF008]
MSVATLAFDPVIHPPTRLQIMAVLAAVQDAEFATLRDTTGVSDSVLSKHLSALGEADYVRLRKAAQDGRQRTWVSLTRRGRSALRGHVAALQALAGVADQPEPSLSPDSAAASV